MTETLSQADFQREYFYQLKLAEQAKAFDELLLRFSPADEGVFVFLRMANAQAAVRDPSYI